MTRSLIMFVVTMVATTQAYAFLDEPAIYWSCYGLTIKPFSELAVRESDRLHDYPDDRSAGRLLPAVKQLPAGMMRFVSRDPRTPHQPFTHYAVQVRLPDQSTGWIVRPMMFASGSCTF